LLAVSQIESAQENRSKDGSHIGGNSSNNYVIDILNMKIAGKNTDVQWFALTAKLHSEPCQALWDSAFSRFYRKRIDTRYLNPIASIPDTQSGEGFAIVALFCSLIEFLESCERGCNFRLCPTPQLLPHEYNQKQASDYFKDFLRNREPFKTLVPSVLVESFYSDVRCALLHEARTKGTWSISSAQSAGTLVSQSATRITLFRRQLVPSLETYFADYRGRLLNNPNTQQAFIRKFDFLCTP
jgi:hypothetical protein